MACTCTINLANIIFLLCLLDVVYFKYYLMSVYDITEFLFTAYRHFAYCVPSNTSLNTAYQKGGFHPSIILLQHIVHSGLYNGALRFHLVCQICKIL